MKSFYKKCLIVFLWIFICNTTWAEDSLGSFFMGLKEFVFKVLSPKEISANDEALSLGSNNNYLPLASAVNSLASTSLADKTIKLDFVFEAPTINIKIMNNTEYKVFMVNGLYDRAKEGEPLLPNKYVHVLIPEGYDIADIQYENINNINYENIVLAPQQKALPIGSSQKPEFVMSQEAYSSSLPLASIMASPLQTLAGYKIMPLAVTPVKYFAKEKRVEYSKQIRVTIKLVKTSSKIQATQQDNVNKNREQNKNRIKDLIYNKQELSDEEIQTKQSLQKLGISSVSASQYDMLIVGPEAFRATFQTYITYKQSIGVKTYFEAVENIQSSQSGVDLQEKIRNYIKYAYNTYGIQYVLLGGDTEYVPVRKVPSYCNYEDSPDWDDTNVITDVYYSCLDGNWDGNGNKVYGEIADNPDLLAEVAVGRFPASNSTELNNIINKSISYQTLSLNSNYLKNVAVYGEALDWTTPASLYESNIGSYLSQNFLVTTHGNNWNKSNVLDDINSNKNQLYAHLGHSNYVTNLRLNISDTKLLTNTLPYMIYSEGCFANFFSWNDAISEEHLKSKNGAYAFIGNSYYGWYSPGSAFGPSAIFEKEFYTVLFNNTNLIGKAMVMARETIAVNNFDDECNRLLFFCISLLGDPSLAFKKNEPFAAKIPEVNDNGKYANSASSLSANWLINTSENISVYKYSVGTEPLLTNVVSWKLTNLSNMNETNLNLENNKSYYVNVQAQNGAGEWCKAGYSDGIVIDTTQSSTPIVIDDGDYTSIPNVLYFQITAEDKESGILSYKYSIGTSKGACDIVDWKVTTNAKFLETNLNLKESIVYYCNVQVKNGAGLWSDIGYSNGIYLDKVNQAPVLAIIPPAAITVDSTLIVSIKATDSDGDKLTYSFSNLPKGATANNQLFYWTPVNGQQGTYYVSANVTDSKGGMNSKRLTITVISTQLKDLGFTLTAINAPNPFSPNNDNVNDTQIIGYDLSAEARVNLSIYTISGTKIREWNPLNNTAPGNIGYNTISWDGRSEQGLTVANGVYYGILSAENLQGEKRRVILKIAVIK